MAETGNCRRHNVFVTVIFGRNLSRLMPRNLHQFRVHQTFNVWCGYPACCTVQTFMLWLITAHFSKSKCFFFPSETKHFANCLELFLVMKFLLLKGNLKLHMILHHYNYYKYNMMLEIIINNFGEQLCWYAGQIWQYPNSGGST